MVNSQSETLILNAWYTLHRGGSLSIAYSLLNNIPDTIPQDANFKTVMTIFLNYALPNDTAVIDSGSLHLLDSIALQCPYIGGDAVYYARALLAQYGDTLFFDDVQLCPIDSADTIAHGGDRMLMVGNPPPVDTTQSSTLTKAGLEFAKVYPRATRIKNSTMHSRMS